MNKTKFPKLNEQMHHLMKSVLRGRIGKTETKESTLPYQMESMANTPYL